LLIAGNEFDALQLDGDVSMEIDMATRLLELRKKSGFSQEKVSEILGVTRQAVSKWENGQGLPDANNLVELGALYNVSVDYLLTGKTNVLEEHISTPDPAITEPEKSNKYTGKRLLFFLLGFAGISIITVLFLFLLTFLLKTFFGG
jgi:transcriptional regulator with XRE-family HTH domain